MVDLLIRRLDAELEAPTRAFEADAGLDLRAAFGHVLGPGERTLVSTGVAVAIPPGHVGLIVPRSGLAKHYGVTVLNAPGVIDPGYRGEVRVLLVNTDGSQAHKIKRGYRIAQLLVVPVADVELVEVDEPFSYAKVGERGADGFGSSGP